MSRRRHLSTPMLLFSVLLGTLPLHTQGAFDKWSLWSDGTRLRGANIWQARVQPELDGLEFKGPGPIGPPYTQADFDHLAALGANYVNISHSGLFTESPPFTLDPEIQDNLDKLLAMIARADMFAVISFRTGPGRSEFGFWADPGDAPYRPYFNDTVWRDRAAQDAWVAMWRHAARHYRANAIVAGYDLMVEPNANALGSDARRPLDIWDPDEFYAAYRDTTYDWNGLYPRISAAIREVDRDTPILIGALGYSAVEWLPYLEPTGDSRTVYAVHQYEPQDQYTHQEPGALVNTYPGVFDANEDGSDERVDRAWLDDLLSVIDDFQSAYRVPVAVNEFGVMRWVPGAARYMQDLMDLFEQRGMNYALWSWEPAWEPFTAEVNDFNFRFGPNPRRHRDMNSNALMRVIVRHWARNTVRPSRLSSMP